MVAWFDRRTLIVPACRAAYVGALLLLVCLALVSCTGSSPSNLGVSSSGMTPCPSSPNCVSSDAGDGDHQVSPLQLAVPATEAWLAARALVSKLPRTRIVSEKPDYLHAECRSALFGFVDDLELNLRPAEGIIAIRSASRIGYSDLGVNRRRVEALRSSLLSRGIIR
jgi:uncharacterized protein (DUF1499 family)